MKCWNCGEELPDPLWGKLLFREECEKCHAALHCCRNCIYYKPGLPNDCAVPGTDFVPDRAAVNFCEEFKLLGKSTNKSKEDTEKAARRLLGEKGEDIESKDPKKKFEDLFGDDK